MIVGALSDVGGREYLAEQANRNPVAFLGLIAKVLPKEISATVTGGDDILQVHMVAQAKLEALVALLESTYAEERLVNP